MVFTHTTTGATGRGTIVRGDVALISGTWASDNVNIGSIITGGSVILAHDVTMGSADTSGTVNTNVGSALILSFKNQTAAGSALAGSIKVSGIDGGSGTGGDWWAIAQI